MDTSKILGVVVLASLVMLAACTTTGTGEGELITNVKNQPETPVKFTWKSTDGGQKGTMTAMIANVIYQGPFFQITHQVKQDELIPLWTGWNDGWYDWPYWGFAYVDDYETMQFIAHYSGKVVANLSNSGGQKIRCRFYLKDPERGVSGGGQGECQLSGGRTIDAIIDPS